VVDSFTQFYSREKRTVESDKCGAAAIVVDGAPGIGCPVIASLANTDLALIVAEPSLSGLSDMLRVVKLTEHFRIRSAV